MCQFLELWSQRRTAPTSMAESENTSQQTELQKQKKRRGPGGHTGTVVGQTLLGKRASALVERVLTCTTLSAQAPAKSRVSSAERTPVDADIISAVGIVASQGCRERSEQARDGGRTKRSHDSDSDGKNG